MKVRFIEETKSDLTNKEEYEVISESKKYYFIKNDEGDEAYYLKKRFEKFKSKKLGMCF